jgi:prepilin-type N-terminal cleavage/methylation domain-containing protein
MKRFLRNKRGFTLVEAMIVIAIIGILAGIGVPSMAEKMQEYRFSAAVRDLQSAVQSARMSAIKRNEKVCMLFDFDGERCTTFVDDGEHDMSLDDGEMVIKTVAMPAGVDMISTFSGQSIIQFNSRGMLMSSDRLEVKNVRNVYRGIAIGITGNSKIVRSADSGASWY